MQRATPPDSGGRAISIARSGLRAGEPVREKHAACVPVAGLLAAGPLAWAATIGLAVGSLATLQGPAATLIAADLAGPDGRTLRVRQLAPFAVAGVLAATLVLAAQQG